MVSAAGFGPDGSHVLSVAGQAAYLWPVAARPLELAVFSHDLPVAISLLSRDGRRALTVSRAAGENDLANEARVWDVAGCAADRRTHARRVVEPGANLGRRPARAALPPLAALARRYESDQFLRLVDGLVNNSRAIYRRRPWVTTLAAAPQPSAAQARLWDAATGRPAGPGIPVPLSPAKPVAAPEQSRSLLLGGRRESPGHGGGRQDRQPGTRLGRATGEAAVPPLPHEESEGVRPVEFSRDGNRLLTLRSTRMGR